MLAHAVNLGLRSLSPKEIIGALAIAPAAVVDVVKRRSDLLVDASFWRLPGLAVDRILDAFDPEGVSAVSIARAMIVAGRNDLAEPALSRFGGAKVTAAIEAASNDNSSATLEEWLRVLGNRPNDLAEGLASGIGLQRPLLLSLAETTDPDSVQSRPGDDPWASAVERSQGALNSSRDDYLAAFLLSRALGRQTGAAGRLLMLSVQQVHTALAAGRMPWKGWQLIDRRLPWVFPWLEWDRCARVRQTVADRFVDFDLDPRQFAIVTDDDSLWLDLMGLATRTGRGRRYLERVRQALVGDLDDRSKRRAQYLEKILR
jgi:hypothetical protein